MKAKIDKNGTLLVLRPARESNPNGWKEQYCPFTASHGEPLLCGEWCPLFYESYFDCRPCQGPTYTLDGRTAKDIVEGEDGI